MLLHHEAVARREGIPHKHGTAGTAGTASTVHGKVLTVSELH